MKFLFLFLIIPHLAFAKIPVDDLNKKMTEFLNELDTPTGWKALMLRHKDQIAKVSETNQGPQVEVIEIGYDVNGERFDVGMVMNSVFINAPTKTVVTTVNKPEIFKELYGLDKSADPKNIGPDEYVANIFKKIPGIFTQDYFLNYKARWEKEAWYQRAKQTKDTENFALRDNSKMVEPIGKGSVYREVSLFLPLKWWLRTNALKSTLQKVTKSEVSDMGKVIRCVAETAKTPEGVNSELAKACRKKL